MSTCAPLVAPQMAKTEVRVRTDGARNLQQEMLLSKSRKHIRGAFANLQMLSNDTKVFVQSAFQRDEALNIR